MKTVTLNDSPANMRLLMQRQRVNRKSPTPAEAHVMDLLTQAGEKFIFEKGIFTERRFFLVDFYFPRPRKLCLELDGEYHERQKQYDAERDQFIMTKRKMNVLRITNATALSLTATTIIDLLDSHPRRPAGRE